MEEVVLRKYGFSFYILENYFEDNIHIFLNFKSFLTLFYNLF